MFELEVITQVAICKLQPAIMLLLTILACPTRCRLAYGLITSNAVLEPDVESSCVSCCCFRGWCFYCHAIATDGGVGGVLDHGLCVAWTHVSVSVLLELVVWKPLCWIHPMVCLVGST